MSCNGNCNQGRTCNYGGVHVVPLNDLRDHATNGNCWCKPTYDEEHDVWVHHALDGREAYETGERKPQ